MQIRGILQPEEHISAQWLHLKPHPFYAMVGWLLLALCLWAVWYLFFVAKHSQNGWTGWVLLGFILYLLLTAFVYIPYGSRRSYHQRKDLQREFTLTITDNGINGSFENGYIEKPWFDYLRWKEGKQLFLLYLSDNVFQIVPKRFFCSIEEVDIFRKTLQEKLQQK